jgi:hypothetical protein
MGDTLQSLFGHGNSGGSKLFKPSYNLPIDQEPISAFKGRVVIVVDITGLNGYENSSLASIISYIFMLFHGCFTYICEIYTLLLNSFAVVIHLCRSYVLFWSLLSQFDCRYIINL